MATSRAAGAFDTFLARAWTDHATRGEAVARRLRTRTPPPQSPAQLSALSRFVVHLLGEHLGRFDDARWRLAALRTHALADDSVQSDLRVGEATLNLGQGADDAATHLNAAEIVRAESGAATLCLGRGQLDRALDFIDRAAARLAALPDPQPQDHRPLAVACNNMAWELQALGSQRSPTQTQAMLRIAAASREHWSRAGTWLHIERAEYCLALTHLSAGLFDDAWRHAGQCLAVCLHHRAPPMEHFYAHEAMAQVHHARREAAELAHHAQAMHDALARMSADDRTTCAGALDAVRALAVRALAA
jgi:hypothetical protein